MRRPATGPVSATGNKTTPTTGPVTAMLIAFTLRTTTWCRTGEAIITGITIITTGCSASLARGIATTTAR